MRERSVDDVTENSTEGDSGRRIDLSVPQVAGSALAAVVAAKLAASFGVYGTILGAGVVSVVATCGGTLFQHFFRRTGEQLKVRRTAEQPRAAGGPSRSGEFGEGTVYRARVRSWRRPVVAAAVVFGVTMGGITTYELITGQNLSGGSSTTVSDALSGHSGSSSDSGDSGGTGDEDGSTASPDPGESTGSGAGGTPAATPSGSADATDDGTSTPDDGSAADGGTTTSPTPTPSATAGQDDADGSGDTAAQDPTASATAPESSASGRSGTDDQGQDDPATP
ncbi:hypothetical protein J7I94_31490 [Streptomyces sp. ISL-12]|uniref:hypothetical protein n=1 Tax=Streptomyces sp. ISL-12 TaxID=2819177 RepID=UPI001BE9D568|nr:hypothetical protein [Streptomyces sp. ISL-12]MBT2415012.1 hypothetical protein [Streptomyces sp. ISL-12]